MNSQTREIKYFFFSQYFSEGLRSTLGILLPSVLFAYLNHPEMGFILSMGAVFASITDTPGPLVHKRNGMLFCSLFAFAVTLLTGFARMQVWLLGLEVFALSFFFSMFMVYGNRAAALGTAALFAMILTMGRELSPVEVLEYSALILAGGLWYTMLSLVLFQIRPYLSTQQALGECIHEVAKYLKLKASFYDLQTNLEEDYQKLVAQQVLVSEKQELVRELMFKTRLQVKESTGQSRALLLTFVDLVDMYEQIMANAYDYSVIRERFGPTGVLEDFAALIREIAEELDKVGLAILTASRYKSALNRQAQLEELKAKIDALAEDGDLGSTLVLKKILINIRNLNHRLQDILCYLNSTSDNTLKKEQSLDLDRFVTHQDFSLKKLRNNLTFSSNVFKHSLRVALVVLFGFVLTKFLNYGQYSYWVLLSILFILKPGFSITKQRNKQRIVGTLIGGLIGALILYFIKDRTVLFILMLFLMVGTHSFMRMNYGLSVIFMTPFVLLVFTFVGEGGIDMVGERVIDTLLGCTIALAASYFLFPNWESRQIKGFMRDVVRANSNYLQKLGERMAGKSITEVEYKLARKEVYISSANLSAAFQRMLSEPGSKQWRSKEVHKFRVLTHVLSSSIAALSTAITERQNQPCAPELLRMVRRSLHILSESTHTLDAATKNNLPEKLLPATTEHQAATLTADDTALKEHLEFILKISSDIHKVTDTATSPKQAEQV